MLRQGEYLDILRKTLRDTHADHAELSAHETLGEVTKFNEGGIFQNISEKCLAVRARVVKEGKMGQAMVEGSLADAARLALKMACEAAPLGQGVPQGYAFPTSPQPSSGLKSLDEETAAYTPGQRAEDLAHAVSSVNREGVDISGSLKLDCSALYVVNTSGLANCAAKSQINANFIAQHMESQSHAGAASTSAADLNLSRLASEAASICQMAQNPMECDTGVYTMVLPPNALADLTPFFGMLLFSGLADLEGRCSLSGRLGTQVASSLVSLRDDGTDPVGIPRPIDEEGVAKRPMQLMNKGVPRTFVHDSLSAAQAGTRTTGHAFPATPAVYGPQNANLIMEPGESSLDDIISGVERGILATRLHYVRCLNDKEALVGGVTSNGTFLIEDGRIKCPVRPMRFSIKLVDQVLKNISAVGRDRLTMIRTAQGPTSVSLFSSAHTLPAVRTDGWQLRGTD